MKEKTICTIILMAVLFVPLWAQAEDDFIIRQNANNTLTITGYNGSATQIVIPETIHGLRVTTIADRAFANKGLTSVVIPDTVTSIEGSSTGGAFSSNPITSLTLGNSVRTIGARAFAHYARDTTNIRLTDLVIPDSLISIGEAAFANTSSSLDRGRGALTRVTFGSGLQTIEQQAFLNNRITTLVLPASLERIESFAFVNNQIRSLVFSNGARTIIEGDTVF